MTTDIKEFLLHRSLARSMLTVAVTIPGSAAPVTVASLIATALAAVALTNENVLGFTVKALSSAGASRAAILLGDATGNMKSFTAADTDASPPISDPTQVYISASGAGTTSATLEVYLV